MTQRTDNYRHNRPNDSTEVFLIGVGDAFVGLANLLVNKGKSYPDIVNLLNGTVRAVES